MSGSEHARPVWLTRKQRDSLANWDYMDIVADWDAAPADSEQAVYEVVSRYSPDHADPADVLRALGYPKDAP